MSLFKAKEPTKITPEDRERYRIEFKRKFGIDCDATGTISPEIRCKVAKCAILTRYGGKYDSELVEELILDAYAECLATELDETFPFRSQASYLFDAAYEAALRTLRKHGKHGGHIPKTINDCEIVCEGDDFNESSYVANKAFDSSSEDATRRIDDEDERKAIRAQFERIKLLPTEEAVLQGLQEGLICSAVAAKLGISRERVKQLVAKIRAKLQQDAPEWFKEKIETIRLNQKRRLSRLEASKKRGETS